MGGGAGALGTVAADDCDIDVLDPFRSGSMLMKRSRGCGRWIKGMGGGAGELGTVAADDCDISMFSTAIATRHGQRMAVADFAMRTTWTPRPPRLPP